MELAADPAGPRPGRRFGRAGGDLGLEPEVGGELGDRPVDGRQVGERRFALAGEQDAEYEPAFDRHLLDVRYAQREAREGAEQPRGDPGPVAAGERDQERGACLVHLEPTVPSGGLPV
jgi:hypothetical protein